MAKQTNIIGFTGHRKLSHDENIIKNIVKENLTLVNADCAVIGMALGFDMLVADVCVEVGIPFVAAIPCQGQSSAWSIEQRNKYSFLLEKSWKSKIISPGPFQVWKLFERNRWIVKRTTMIMSYWDGIDKGGTAATVKEAQKLGRPHVNLFPLCNTK